MTTVYHYCLRTDIWAYPKLNKCHEKIKSALKLRKMTIKLYKRATLNEKPSKLVISIWVQSLLELLFSFRRYT